MTTELDQYKLNIDMFILPDLPYGYNALEPFIDEETMHIHHDKHHAAYIKNLNDALVGHDDLLNMDVDDLLKNLDKAPEEVRQKVKNNAGGHSNHSLFWQLMIPVADFVPARGGLAEAIDKTFESFDNFKKLFTEKAMGRFGSGWVWLTVSRNKDNNDESKLEIIDTANQDSPITDGKTVILGLDVWEHAYYLKYKNVRADYVSAWWNIVNWSEVERRFSEIK